MTWQSIEIVLDTEQEQAFSELILEHGALSVTTAAADDTEIFEIDGQIEDNWVRIKLTGLFDVATDTSGLIEQLATSPGIQFTIKVLEDQNWERAWLDHFVPVQVSEKLWVVPSWHDPIDKNAVNIQIDPGMSFGTGTHESTRLCLSWLSDLDLSRKTILDYGCGSGILAIGALKLGAEKALATDIEPRSLAATLENAEKNDVAQQIETYLPESLPVQKVGIVVANILATTIIDLKNVLLSHLEDNGQLLLAGILLEQESMVKQAMPNLRWQTRIKGNWVALLGQS